MSKVHIAKDAAMEFIESALPIMESFETTQTACPNCGCNVRFPIIARQQDIDRMEKLFEAAAEVLDADYGLMKKIMAKTMGNIRDELMRQKGVVYLDCSDKTQ